jgi:hypothetical protein
MAWSVWPSRHGRPAVSEMITPRRSPVAEANRSRSSIALASGSRGKSKIDSAARLELSIPAAAIVKPVPVRTIRVSPRRAIVRVLSDVISSARREAGSMRPSALLMILDVTTRMSPSRSGPADRRRWLRARARQDQYQATPPRSQLVRRS